MLAQLANHPPELYDHPCYHLLHTNNTQICMYKNRAFRGYFTLCCIYVSTYLLCCTFHTYHGGTLTNYAKFSGSRVVQ